MLGLLGHKTLKSVRKDNQVFKYLEPIKQHSKRDIFIIRMLMLGT